MAGNASASLPAQMQGSVRTEKRPKVASPLTRDPARPPIPVRPPFVSEPVRDRRLPSL